MILANSNTTFSHLFFVLSLLKKEEKRIVDLQVEYEKIMQEISASQKKEETSLDKVKSCFMFFPFSIATVPVIHFALDLLLY